MKDRQGNWCEVIEMFFNFLALATKWSYKEQSRIWCILVMHVCGVARNAVDYDYEGFTPEVAGIDVVVYIC